MGVEGRLLYYYTQDANRPKAVESVYCVDPDLEEGYNLNINILVTLKLILYIKNVV